MKRHPFNLIELMLALGVIVVGLVSVMALFPVGANANRDAMAENYASQAAEEMLNSLAYHLRSQPTTLAEWTALRSKIVESTGSAQTDAQTIADQQPVPGASYTKQCDLVPGGTATIFAKPASVGFDYTGGFRIESSGSASYKDFEAMAAIWQEQIAVVSGSPLSYDYGTVLNMEISWPAQLPYSRRQKARYRLEVFNPHNQP